MRIIVLEISLQFPSKTSNENVCFGGLCVLALKVKSCLPKIVDEVQVEFTKRDSYLALTLWFKCEQKLFFPLLIILPKK